MYDRQINEASLEKKRKEINKTFPCYIWLHKVHKSWHNGYIYIRSKEKPNKKEMKG